MLLDSRHISTGWPDRKKKNMRVVRTIDGGPSFLVAFHRATWEGRIYRGFTNPCESAGFLNYVPKWKKNTGKEATVRKCHLCSGVYQFDEETIKTSASSSENATFSFLIYKYIFIQIMIELRHSMIVTVLIKFKLRMPFLEFPESAFILNLIKKTLGSVRISFWKIFWCKNFFQIVSMQCFYKHFYANVFYRILKEQNFLKASEIWTNSFETVYSSTMSTSVLRILATL